MDRLRVCGLHEVGLDAGSDLHIQIKKMTAQQYFCTASGQATVFAPATLSFPKSRHCRVSRHTKTKSLAWIDAALLNVMISCAVPPL